MKDVILYIDDEQANLITFKYTFEDHFTILTAQSTKEAELLLKNNLVKVVLSDQRMPNETGIEFINRIQEIYPDVIFIVLTAFADVNATIDAINSGRVFRFLAKPWNLNEMLMTLTNGIDKYNLQKQNNDLLIQLSEKNRHLVNSLNQINITKKHYKTIADFTYDWEYWLLPENIFRFISPSCKRITGYSKEEFIQHPDLLHEIIQPEDLSLWKKHEDDVKSGKSDLNEVIFRIITKQGEIKWISHTCKKVYENSNEYLGIRGSNRDITERKNAEAKLKESEERFKKLSNLTFEGILIHENGIVRDANIALEKMSGYPREELLGKNFFKYCIPEKYIDLLKQKIRLDIVKPYEFEIIRKDKTILPVQVSARWISKSENLRVASIRDITEQKQIQQQILNAIIKTEEEERRRIAQELHDGIGPILSTVKLFTQTYMGSNDDVYKDKIKSELYKSIDEALEQVSQISNNLSPHVLNDFGLKSAVQKFIDKLKKFTNLEISFHCNLNVRLKDVIEITLYRVITELINNTIKHTNANKATIDIVKTEKIIKVHYVDNGPGFDFNEIIQMKKGMGLFNITNRIESLNGEARFENIKGSGIIVNIALPLDNNFE